MIPRLHPPEARLLDHVAGGTDPAARALMECHLALCDACAARMAGLSQAGGVLLAQQRPIAAPADLFNRIMAQVDQEPQLPGALPFTRALAPYLPADFTRGWRGALAAGFRFLELGADLPKGVGFYLARMAPGKPFPDHLHQGTEDLVVLAGGFQDGGERMEAGDWSTMAAATRHAPRALDGEDCWVVARTEADIRFKGWRGLIQRLA
jgi:putative transcriptional regulator